MSWIEQFSSITTAYADAVDSRSKSESDNPPCQHLMAWQEHRDAQNIETAIVHIVSARRRSSFSPNVYAHPNVASRSSKPFSFPLLARYAPETRSSSWQLTRLHHARVLLLEALTQSLRSLHVLVHASHDASLFSWMQGLGCEVVNAIIEASLDKIGIHLSDHSISDLRPERSGLKASIGQIGHDSSRTITDIHELFHLLLLHACLQLALLLLI